MKLYIIRHARALHDDYFPGDVYRALDDVGYAEATMMAMQMAPVIKTPDLIISSPAVRAYTTALVFANHLNYYANRIEINAAVYEANYITLLNVISEVAEEIRSLVITGHNPGLGDLVNYLCNPVLNHLPTCGVVEISFETKGWNLIKAGSGKMINKYFP